MRMLARVVLALAIGTPAVRPAHGQVRASERATISQVIDGTTFTIDYARPRVRGRSPLFGSRAVQWGEVWTPGANWATTLDVSRDVMLDGHAVAKGKYSVWFQVQPAEWTVVLDPRFKRYHTEHPDSTAQQIRWKIKPTTGEFTEALTWTFPEIRPDGALLRMQWGTMVASIDATVKPTYPLAIARSAAEPYVGRYSWKWIGPDGKESPADTVELYYEAGSLRQRYAKVPRWYPMIQGAIMARINDDWFIPVILEQGKIWEMVADMVYEFRVVNGTATGFELRDDRDTLMGRGVRVGSR